MFLYMLVATTLSAVLQMDPDKLLESRCLKNANKDAWKEAEGAMPDYTFCSYAANQLPSNKDDITDAFCSTSFQTCYTVLEYAVNKIEPCLNLEEKYFPKFVLDCYNASADMECRDGYMKARISAIDSANCTEEGQMLKDSLRATCNHKLEHLKMLNEPDYVLTISDFCSGIATIKECVVDSLKTLCGDDENMIGFIAEDFNVALDLCNRETSGNFV